MSLKTTYGFSVNDTENNKHIEIQNIAKEIWRKSESFQQFNEAITAKFSGNKKVKLVFDDKHIFCKYIYPKSESIVLFSISLCNYIVPQKSVERVDDRYTLGTKDHRDQYRMLLPDGKKCSDCRHVNKCCTMFGQNSTATKCQFGDNRFSSY